MFTYPAPEPLRNRTSSRQRQQQPKGRCVKGPLFFVCLFCFSCCYFSTHGTELGHVQTDPMLTEAAEAAICGSGITFDSFQFRTTEWHSFCSNFAKYGGEKQKVRMETVSGKLLFVLNILSHSNAACTTELGDACFSNTYQKVQQMSDEVWSFYRLSLIHEYCDRPCLVAPLNVLFRVYRTICYSCSCDCMFDLCKRWKAFSK